MPSGEHQSKKTHCPKGHEYTPDNTRINARGWRVCKTCARETERRRYKQGLKAKQTPEYRRDWDLKRKYGIGLSDFEAMRDHQDGRCAVCKESRELVLDHCHATGAVRGLLCSRCNSLLGFVNDDPAILRGAIEYLEIHLRRKHG